MNAIELVTVAGEMMKEGITPDTHHARVKRIFEEKTGEKLGEGEVPSFQEFKGLMQEVQATPAEEQKTKRRARREAQNQTRRRSKDPKPWTIARYRKEHPDRKHVTDIVEVSERTGRPTQVEITCTVGGETRIVKAQDAFQVKTCGKPEHLREYRKQKRASN